MSNERSPGIMKAPVLRGQKVGSRRNVSIRAIKMAPFSNTRFGAASLPKKRRETGAKRCRRHRRAASNGRVLGRADRDQGVPFGIGSAMRRRRCPRPRAGEHWLRQHQVAAFEFQCFQGVDGDGFRGCVVQGKTSRTEKRRFGPLTLGDFGDFGVVRADDDAVERNAVPCRPNGPGNQGAPGEQRQPLPGRRFDPPRAGIRPNMTGTPVTGANPLAR